MFFFLKLDITSLSHLQRIVSVQIERPITADNGVLYNLTQPHIFP